jgi:single-strand DNA-binding protein
MVEVSGRRGAAPGGPADGPPGRSQEDGMINEAQVFLSGYVARDPRFRITTTGISSVSLRVAYTPRRVDRESGEWTDGTTSFVTVVCWRTLADNVARCLHKGEPVLVKGRLQVRPYEKDGVSRLAVEVEATSVGHDLARGVASFQRPRRVLADQATGNGTGNGHAVQAGPGGGPVAEAGMAEAGVGAAGVAEGGMAEGGAAEAGFNGAGQAVDALDRPNGSDPGRSAPDGSGEPAGLSAPF